jgi:hypothetical protein
MDGNANPVVDGLESQRVIALFTRQRDLYRQLQALADRQRAMVTSSAPETLLSVLAQRQKIVSQLSALNEDVKTARERWPDIYGRMDIAQRREADSLLGEVQTTLADILAGDERDAKLLSARMEGVRQQSASLAEARRAHAAYGVGSGGGGTTGRAGARIIDQTDEQA